MESESTDGHDTPEYIDHRMEMVCGFGERGCGMGSVGGGRGGEGGRDACACTRTVPRNMVTQTRPVGLGTRECGARVN